MLPPGDSGENKDDFIELQTQLIEDLRPEGILEGMQVEKIAVCYWRLRRAIRCEVGEIRKDQEMISIRSAFTDETLSLSELTNDVQTFENVSKRVKKAIDAILPHMQGLEKSGHEYMDRKFMEALNESHSEEFKECQSALVDRREEMETTAYDVLQIVEKLHENKTEPLIHSLPGKEAVDKILRYETAIERQLYKAMSELDRLQGRRRGEVAPPTINVDVSRE